MGNDIWQAVTLGSVFPAMNTRLSGVSASMDKLLGEASFIIGEFNKKAESAEAMLQMSSNMAKQLSEAGFYMLPLSPGKGTVNQRITSSPNPPLGEFTCGIVIVASTPDIATAIERYQSLQNILTSTI